jgi:hypothetical protein
MIIVRPVVMVIPPAVTIIAVRVFAVYAHRNTGWGGWTNDAPRGD